MDAKPNRLINEKSPYLLQHAHNPVDWFPWGEEAFAKAHEENKPVFLSIGYSTCHWCHVMERESFEDADVAALMNATVVAVKVDREERPDLDSLYMTFAQAMAGRGGWPLTVIMTPDKKPFFAGTYFPKENGPGRIGLMEILRRITNVWTSQRADVDQSAESILAQVRAFSEDTSREGGTDALPGPETLSRAAEEFAEDFDPVHNGFGRAPKFPSAHNLLFLLRQAARKNDPKLLDMVAKTLTAMRQGGIWDHVGFGFHRYSTDERWLLPHFEKMLYDQAMLAMAYTEAFQATKNPLFRQTAMEIFEYVQRDMTGPEGAFYSAEDADSEGEEGKFYVWSVDEIRNALPEEEAGLFMEVFAFKAEGNFKDEATGRQTGANIPHLEKPLAAWAIEYGLSETEFATRLEAARTKLFALREKRPRPYRDDKILTDWNGLAIAALAKAARAFDRPELAERAAKAADFILTILADARGRLLHRFRDGEAALPAHLDDHAFLMWGLTELYQATFAPKYLDEALRLASALKERFEDADQGGFFLTASDAEELLLRQKDLVDAAIPSGNAAAMPALLKLARLTGRSELEQTAARQIRAFAPNVAQRPSAFAMFLCGLSLILGPAAEIVIAGNPDAPDTKKLLRAVNEAFLPDAVLLLRPHGDAPDIANLAPFVADMRPLDGQAAAYVCRDGACQQPVTEPTAMLTLLQTE